MEYFHNVQVNDLCKVSFIELHLLLVQRKIEIGCWMHLIIPGVIRRGKQMVESKGGSISSMPVCGLRDLSSNPAWDKLERTNFIEHKLYCFFDLDLNKPLNT